jgi:AraC-like DNA-binding protein
VRRVKDFIRNNIGASLRIETVAKVAHLSASYFSRAFKSATGGTYSDFVTLARVDRAKSLLLTTNDPISEIALICGFADQSHLTRMFSRVVGSPPNTWRRQERGTSRYDLCSVRKDPNEAPGSCMDVKEPSGLAQGREQGAERVEDA